MNRQGTFWKVSDSFMTGLATNHFSAMTKNLLENITITLSEAHEVSENRK